MLAKSAEIETQLSPINGIKTPTYWAFIRGEDYIGFNSAVTTAIYPVSRHKRCIYKYTVTQAPRLRYCILL